MRDHRRGNMWRTATLLSGASAAVVGAASYGGPDAALAGAVGAAGLSAWSWYRGDRLVLRAMRARLVSEAEQPRLHAVVRDLALAARLPVPRVYVAPFASPNAFTTGRSPRTASLCVTSGLLTTLDEQELRGVLAHELAHVAHRDSAVSTVATALGAGLLLAATLPFLALAGDDDDDGPVGAAVLLVLAPLAALLVRLATTRHREHRADLAAVTLTGDPAALAQALRRIDVGSRVVRLRLGPALRPAGAMMVVDPRRTSRLGRLLSTHPPVQDRVRRLEELAGR